MRGGAGMAGDAGSVTAARVAQARQQLRDEQDKTAGKRALAKSVNGLTPNWRPYDSCMKRLRGRELLALLAVAVLGAFLLFRDGRRVEGVEGAIRPVVSVVVSGAERASAMRGAGSAPSESTHGVARSGRPDPSSWSEIGIRSDLRKLIADARRSPRPEDRLAVVRVSAVCHSTQARQQMDATTTRAAEPVSSVNLFGFDSTTQSAMKTATSKLLGFCQGIEDADVEQSLTSLFNDVKREASPSKQLLNMSALGKANWTQEQVQAAMQVLSQPSLYPRGADMLIERVIVFPAIDQGAALSFADVDKVKSLVYQELTGDRDPQSIRNLFACVNQGVCDLESRAAANDDQARRLAQIAQATVDAIRSQRWAAIGL
ncbi:MAG: hypothetical protein HY021_11370 [Burkholderiales bacterium]|nr:hypothetical protein [Burkholderiales bacterium]